MKAKQFLVKNADILTLLTFAFFFIALWPSGIIITDSYSYATQALAFSSGTIESQYLNFITGVEEVYAISPYNIGTAVYLAFFVAIGGSKLIFLAPLVAVISSYFLLRKACSNLQLPQTAGILLLISAPVLFFSRSLMSCMPSLLVISICVYFYSIQNKRSIQFFMLAFFTGLSIWYRETNIILTSALLISCLWENRSFMASSIVGVILGLAVRVVANHVVYDDAFFLSASSGFSLASFPTHAFMYLIIVLLLVPAGFMYAVLRGKKHEIIAIVLFICLYSFYNYSAVDYSGFTKGTLLTSRFMIPLIPFFVLAFGRLLAEKHTFHEKYKVALIPIAMGIIAIAQLYFHNKLTPHYNATTQLQTILKDKNVIYDQSGLTNIIRYMNPLGATWKGSADLSRNNDLLQAYREEFYVVLSDSTGNTEKQARTSSMKAIVKNLDARELSVITIDSDNVIRVFVVNQSSN